MGNYVSTRSRFCRDMADVQHNVTRITKKEMYYIVVDDNNSLIDVANKLFLFRRKAERVWKQF